MIIAQNIHKSFGYLNVLDGVDLKIKKGSIFGLAGRSGAGKSTLLRCINGLEPYDKGRLLVDGVDVKQLSPKQLRAFRKNVGMVFQNFSLLERLSAFDNVALPLKCWKAESSHLNKKVKELLGLVGLSDKIKHKPRELSGGQKQRVAIARALSLNPKILLCDEATSALDPKTAQDILSLLRQINDHLDLTIVMVTHQMSVLKSTCSEVAILENGRLDTQGPVQQIFEKLPLSLRNIMGEDIGSQACRSSFITLSLDCTPDLPADLADKLGIEVTLIGVPAEESISKRLIRIPEHRLKPVAEYLSRHAIGWQIQPESCFTRLN